MPDLSVITIKYAKPSLMMKSRKCVLLKGTREHYFKSGITKHLEEQNMNTTDIKEAVNAEVRRITTPELIFHSDHEAYAVLLEEVEEALDEIHKTTAKAKKLKKQVFGDAKDTAKIGTLSEIRRRAILAAAESVQVAAVATKIMRSKGVDI